MGMTDGKVTDLNKTAFPDFEDGMFTVLGERNEVRYLKRGKYPSCSLREEMMSMLNAG